MTGGGHDKVLVVDDEPEILVALQDLLEEDHIVLVANSAAEALDILRHDPDIAVIVSDQRMPGLDGDAFLSEARRISAAEALLLTGYADLEAVVRAVNNGRIAAYSPKPWDPAALRSLVASARERYRLARALETEQRLLQGLLNFSPDALSFKDRERRLIRLNGVKAEALRTTVAACLGRREEDLLPTAEAAEGARADAEAIATGRPGIAHLERHDGTTVRHFDVNRIPILGRDGRVEWLAVIEREVTEARQLEAQLRQSDKLQALGTLAGGVAHDFNNLLTAIIGSIRLASRPGIDPKRVEHLLGVALSAAERGASLTQRLLSFSRRRNLALRATDVNRLLDGMGDLLTRSLGGVVQVERRLSPALWPAVVDPDQLELVVLNLCVNARDAMEGGGTVRIATRNVDVTADKPGDLTPGDYVVISVTDHGCGIPPHILSRVLEPFFTTKDVGSGTGLGLSMAYGMARQSGGTLRIRSAVGEGTTVEVFLRRAEQEPQGSVTGAVDSLPRATRRVRILLADDDARVREVTSAALQESGHRVFEAPDAEVALEILAREDVDLIITDFGMPRVSGLDFAAQARAQRPAVPLLLITGHADLPHVPRDLPVLQKPFEPARLAAKVAALTALPASEM